MEAPPRGDLKLTGKLLEQHRYLFLHLHHTPTTKSILHSRTGWCMYTTNRVCSVAPGLRCTPLYKTHRPSSFSSTHSAQLHPLILTPLDTPVTFYSQKAKARENVSQRWFCVFVHFSQQRLTKYRSSTDASTPPADISSLCRHVCKTVTGRIACSAGDTTTPLVNAVRRTSACMIYSWSAFARYSMQVSPMQEVGSIGFLFVTGELA